MSDNEVIDVTNDNDSDCEIQNPEISIVELEDSNDENLSSSDSNEDEDSEDEKNVEIDVVHVESQECIEVNQNQNDLFARIDQNEDYIEVDQSQESMQNNENDQNQIDNELFEVNQTEENFIQLNQNEQVCQLNQVDSSQNQTQPSQSQGYSSERSQTEDNLNDNKNVLFQMIFCNKDKYTELKSCITESLNVCLKNKGINIEFMEDEHFLKICAITKSAIVEKGSIENDKISNVEVVDGLDDFCFQIDATPQSNVDKRKVPSYKRSAKDVLIENPKKPKLDIEECARPKANACFNCFGNHSLKDCPEPRNQQRIKKNRKAHSSRSERYHNEGNQKYPHLKAGKISNNLRKALGLHNDEIPSFIYKMRVLGYPPGWLEDAKIPPSGLTLFDSEGRKVLESDEEDGEVDVEKFKYDPEKIISFPGYNVDPGPEFYDNYRQHGVPPMLPKFRKEEFIKSLGDENILKGYKRKKFKDLSMNTATETENVPEDMEIENIDNEMTFGSIGVPSASLWPADPVPVPPRTPPPPPPPPPPEESEETETISEQNNCNKKARNSPSLAELEEKQKQLLEALQSSSTSILDISSENLPSVNNTETVAQIENKDELQENNKNNETEINTNLDETIYENNESTLEGLHTNSNTPSQSNNNSKVIVLGTPLLKFSPYEKLPSGEKFSVGVSDVINFENLADSTGKYEQMKKVLKKVRNVVTQLNMNE